METKKYDRERAVAYALRWALKRNPDYYNFDQLGGDCTNFTSQVLYAGSAVMNPKNTFGWYYQSVGDYAPAWTGVEFLYRFLINNKGAGPVAVETDLAGLERGDLIQLSFDGQAFTHSLVVVSAPVPSTPSNLLIATHTYDSVLRPLDSYTYEKARFLHITHVNAP